MLITIFFPVFDQQLAKAKEDILSNFLVTVTKVSRLSAGLLPIKKIPKVARPGLSSVDTLSSKSEENWTSGNLETFRMYSSLHPHLADSLSHLANHASSTSSSGDQTREKTGPKITARESTELPSELTTHIPVSKSSHEIQCGSESEIQNMYVPTSMHGLRKEELAQCMFYQFSNREAAESSHLIPVNLAKNQDPSTFNKAAVAAARCTTWVQDSTSRENPGGGNQPKTSETTSSSAAGEGNNSSSENTSSPLGKGMVSTSSVEVLVDTSGFSDSSRSCDSGMLTGGATTGTKGSSSNSDEGGASGWKKKRRKSHTSIEHPTNVQKPSSDTTNSKTQAVNGSGSGGEWSRSSSATPSPPSLSSSPESSDPQSGSTASNQAEQTRCPSWKKRYCELYGGEGAGNHGKKIEKKESPLLPAPNDSGHKHHWKHKQPKDDLKSKSSTDFHSGKKRKLSSTGPFENSAIVSAKKLAYDSGRGMSDDDSMSAQN